jgi:demethylspheroidene O-methyltransferase
MAGDIWRILTAPFAAWRNRLLANPQFQDWASRSIFTRGQANAYAGRMLDLAVGFAYARTLLACVQFDVFERLRAGPQSTDALAGACGLAPARMRVLAKAAAALDLIEPAGGDRWRLAPLGASLLGNPGVAAMIAHHSLLYEDLRDPAALIRGDIDAPHVQGFWPYGAHADPRAAAQYSALMAATQTMIARQILAAYPLARHRRLIDIGGGEGAFVQHALRAAPKLSATVADLPAVAVQALAAFKSAGLSARADAFAVTAPGDSLPAGADLHSFVRVLHDHDDPAVVRFLAASHAALAPGGRILIAEPMAETPGARGMGHAYFGLYLLAMGQGRPRTRAELSDLLRGAGFSAVREHRAPQPALVRLLSARK